MEALQWARRNAFRIRNEFARQSSFSCRRRSRCPSISLRIRCQNELLTLLHSFSSCVFSSTRFQSRFSPRILLMDFYFVFFLSLCAFSLAANQNFSIYWRYSGFRFVEFSVERTHSGSRAATKQKCFCLTFARRPKKSNDRGQESKENEQNKKTGCNSFDADDFFISLILSRNNHK